MSAQGAGTFRIPAEVYDNHVGRYARELAEGLVAVAGVRAGHRALDIGCGPGGLASVLAGVLGPANVAAVDPSEPFVETCRARLPGVDVRLGTAERLPFGEATFDAVLSQLVVNFVSDARAALREMRRVARPGGLVASAVWDYSGEMTLLRTFWDAALAVDPERGRALDEGRVMPYCREGELGELWQSAGLDAVVAGQLVVGADYESFDELWEPFATGLAPSGAYFASLDEERQRALLADWRRRLGSPEGSFRLTARAWYAVGRAQ